MEVIVGAILTQNTAWRNVEQAIRSLKSRHMLSIAAILDAEDNLLAEAIRPAGYFNIKTKRLKSFFYFLQQHYNSNLDDMFAQDLWSLRARLLQVYGIGEETADCILLYAGGKPIFVVDAYTRRLLSRHGMIDETASYQEIQTLFMKNLTEDVSLFNQYHALIVQTGKHYCAKTPRCSDCPLFSLNNVKG